jgi:hypothetical protein
MNVTISESELLTERITVHLLDAHQHSCASVESMCLTYQKVNAINRLAGPPLIKDFPICTYSAVPMVPPMPMS